jgi:hypothetical protein
VASGKDYAAPTAPVPQAQEVRALVVQFSGPEQLGRSVATILNLQLWRTLRSAPTPNTDKLNFGKGAVVWLGKPLASADHATAGKTAQPLNISAQHVLWGRVHMVGEEALVTAYLTIPDYFDFRTSKHELWQIDVEAGGERQSLSADVPQRNYAFEPIVLPAAFVRAYDTPDSIPISSQKQGGRQIGFLGSEFTRLANDGDDAKVNAGGKTGWVHLPEIGKHKPEIVDFISGILRIYRADWAGAIGEFRRVIDNPAAPTSLLVDSYLYLIRAKSELGQNADADIDAVTKLTLPSRRVVQYAAMHYIGRCHGGGTGVGQCNDATRQRLVELVDKSRALFPSDDRWLGLVLKLLGI